MSVFAFRGRDPVSEARALLHGVLQDGDIIGTDDAGRTALLLLIDPWTLDRLLTYNAGAEDLEDTEGEPEPDQEMTPRDRARLRAAETPRPRLAG